MQLPFAGRAFIDDRKLLGYCLDEDHPIGKHKARVFKAALSLDQGNYRILKLALLAAA